MKIQDHLDRTLTTTEDLGLVAFGDLTTGMILNWAARTPRPREVMDLLGEKAVESFALVAGAGRPDQADPAGFGTTIVHFTETATDVFARAPDSDEDVICAVGTPGAPIGPLMRAAAGLATTLAEAP